MYKNTWWFVLFLIILSDLVLLLNHQRNMLARCNSTAVLSQTCTRDAAGIHSYFEGQGIMNGDKMIPLDGFTKCGRRLSTDNRQGGGVVKRNGLSRLNSAPELFKAELPPINHARGNNGCAERKNRPLTPLVLNSNRKQSSQSLPKNYRINLDLVPLVEVGTGIGSLAISRTRQSSLSSSDSCFSSSTPSPRLKIRANSPRPPSEAKDDPLEKLSAVRKWSNSAESLEEVCSDDEDVNGKDTMILRWLQNVEKSHEATAGTGELLPSITEGKLA